MLQFTLTGRLATDPELTTYGPDNTPMARLRVASNQPGSQDTDFFDVAVFGDKALATTRDLHKGDKVHLKGSGRQHVWTTNSGDRRERVSLNARSVEHTPAIAQHTTTATVDTTRSATTSATR
jgi:single-stranded DNA-binding protein